MKAVARTYRNITRAAAPSQPISKDSFANEIGDGPVALPDGAAACLPALGESPALAAPTAARVAPTVIALTPPPFPKILNPESQIRFPFSPRCDKIVDARTDWASRDCKRKGW